MRESRSVRIVLVIVLVIVGVYAYALWSAYETSQTFSAIDKLVTLPSPTAPAVAAAASPSPSPASTPTPTPTLVPKAAYPIGWLSQACKALGSLAKTLAYRDDLTNALSVEDYYAIGQIGGYIAGEAFTADNALDQLPKWSPDATFYGNARVTATEFEDAGGALKKGGENYSVTNVESGVQKYAAGIGLLSETMKAFATLGEKYKFDCRGQ